MRMKGRSLLFSLLAVPACQAAVPASVDEAEDDPRVPDGGDPEQFDASCEAYFRAYYTCYEDGEYGSSGGPDLDAYVTMVCAEIKADAESEGPGCLAAYEEVLACIASLDCASLPSDGGNETFPEPCTDVYRGAIERCPGGFSACTSGSVGAGDDPETGVEACEVEATGCIDGHVYAADCTRESGWTCDCKVDGESIGTATIATDDACFGDEFRGALGEACGFPIDPF